ncbi:MAG TPA: serine hydrolase domain-containing protein, partial [Thermomicrobiales bacterium]|nr:serine hydrolase domain-containing protein [Thermomicrobiales bacterium]
IVEGDQIVHSRGFGESGSTPITPQTPFAIGSLTKSFTALSIMQLVEDGKISLDDPVQRYIPWFTVADADAAARITVRHLLNQTSGLSRATGIRPLLEESTDTIEQYVRNLREAELNRPVGASYEYSNANYVTLGLIVEMVSGQQYGDYVRQHVFEPLDMRDSYASHEEGRRQGMSDVHQFWFGVPVKAETPTLPAQGPTGFLVASAEDMARYLSMYLNEGSYQGRQILSPAGIEAMLAPATNTFDRTLLGTEFTARYGMGWFNGPFGDSPALWHLGELPTFNAWMVLLPETNQTVVVLINAGSQMPIAGATEVFSRIPIGVTQILTGNEPPTGMSLTRFYVVFDLIVLAIVGIQTWALARLLRRPATPPRRPRSLGEGWALARQTVPLAWEVGLGSLILLGYPALTGISWRGSFTAAPDLVIVLLVVNGLWLVTGITRIVRFAGLVL